MSTELVPPTLRLIPTTGFMGGLRTYSSFNYETTRFLQQRAWATGIANYATTTVRIFVGDGDKWYHQQLGVALIERLRREGFAGATVIHGVAGFGARSIIHTAHLIDLSETEARVGAGR